MESDLAPARCENQCNLASNSRGKESVATDLGLFQQPVADLPGARGGEEWPYLTSKVTNNAARHYVFLAEKSKQYAHPTVFQTSIQIYLYGL